MDFPFIENSFNPRLILSLEEQGILFKNNDIYYRYRSEDFPDEIITLNIDVEVNETMEFNWDSNPMKLKLTNNSPRIAKDVRIEIQLTEGLQFLDESLENKSKLTTNLDYLLESHITELEIVSDRPGVHFGEISVYLGDNLSPHVKESFEIESLELPSFMLFNDKITEGWNTEFPFIKGALSRPLAHDFFVPYEIVPITADESDFEAMTGTIRFKAGNPTGQSENIAIRDGLFEPIEFLQLNLDLSQLKQGRIEQIELPLINFDFPELRVSDITKLIFDENETLTLVIGLNKAVNEPVRVSYSTLGVSAEFETDYEIEAGYVLFEPGETLKTISIPVKSNAESTSARVFDIIFYESDDVLFKDFRSRISLLPFPSKLFISDYGRVVVNLRVNGDVYYNYRVFYSTDLDQVNWRFLPLQEIDTDGHLIYQHDINGGNSVFFHLEAIIQ